MYNPKSLKAEEFIDHQEILDTLAYADENKDNLELIDQILNKARERKGLSHREGLCAAGLRHPREGPRSCTPWPSQIKKDFYGNRIVIFAPLYLSNYCVNGCLYCPYHQKNKHIPRKKLTQEEVEKEVIALQDMGHKRLAIETGEDPVNCPIEYVLDCIHTIYSIKHKNGAIRRVNVNIGRHHRGELPQAEGGGHRHLRPVSRRPTTRRATSTCTPPAPRATTAITPRPWTGLWRAASTTWAWASCSAWSCTAMNSPGC